MVTWSHGHILVTWSLHGHMITWSHGHMVTWSHGHVIKLTQEDYIGTLSYFLLNVKSPPPELLLDDPAGYEVAPRSKTPNSLLPATLPAQCHPMHTF